MFKTPDFKTYSVDNYIPNINGCNKHASSWSDHLSDLHERMVKLQYDHETGDYDNYIFCLFLGLRHRSFLNHLGPTNVLRNSPSRWGNNIQQFTAH